MKKKPVNVRQFAKFGEFRFRDRLPKDGETKAEGAIRAELTTTSSATVANIFLYDVIDSWGGFWGISATEFAEVLALIPSTVTKINLRINSPGGEVYEAIAILNLLRSHAATVTAIVDGLAASAASFVACGCDQLYMGENTDLMIHDAWAVAAGNADDFREFAGFLDRISDKIAAIYAAKSGGDPADWRAVMKDEAWYGAEEAVTALLADFVGMPSDDDNEDGGDDDDDEQDPAEPDKSLDPESPEPGYFSRAAQQAISALKTPDPETKPEPAAPAADFSARISAVDLDVRERKHRMSRR